MPINISLNQPNRGRCFGEVCTADNRRSFLDYTPQTTRVDRSQAIDRPPCGVATAHEVSSECANETMICAAQDELPSFKDTVRGGHILSRLRRRRI